MIKSKREIEIIRKATEIAGLAIIEAMRSTKPGVYEYQLDAAAKYIFYLHGSRGDGYASIIGGGTNAYFGHYFHKTDKLKDGDLVLMDYAPDYRYYTSDVTRMWPVNGKYTEGQRALRNIFWRIGMRSLSIFGPALRPILSSIRLQKIWKNILLARHLPIPSI